MRRFIWIALGILAGLFCLDGAAAAEGLTLYGDYSVTEFQITGFEVEAGTVGAELAGTHWLVGGQYSFSTGFDPEPSAEADIELNTLMVWGGYDFIESEQHCLAAVAAYVRSGFDIEYSFLDLLEGDLSSWAIGVKASATWKPFTLSLLYLYGIENELDGELIGSTFSTDDVDYNYLELKAAWDISEVFGIYLAYRSSDWGIGPFDLEREGIALGMELKF